MIRFLMEIKMLSQKEIEIRTDLINGLKKQEVHRYSDRLVNQSVTYYLENCTSLEEFTDTLKDQSFLRPYKKSVVYGNILKDSLLEISDLQDMYNITVEDNQEDKGEQAKIALDDFSKTLDIIKSFAKEQNITL